jgi:hypothetical protein
MSDYDDSHENIQPTNPEQVREMMLQNLASLEPKCTTAIGLCTLLINADGGVEFFTVHMDGGRLPLIAATALAQNNMIGMVHSGDNGRMHVPGDPDRPHSHD